MSEILTLQFGPTANYVGSHFWNLQVSFNVLKYNFQNESTFIQLIANIYIIYTG